jgi:hypothetical protein
MFSVAVWRAGIMAAPWRRRGVNRINALLPRIAAGVCRALFAFRHARAAP